MPDERLAALAARGSAGAVTAIVERHQAALGQYCRSILGNEHDAQDALQNTLVKAMRGLDGETREIALRPWLYRIAHNEAISMLRGRRTDQALAVAEELAGHADAHEAAEVRERLATLARDLDDLTPKQRSSLLLRELCGLKFAEIAAVMQVSPAAAKQSVHEGRSALFRLQEGRSLPCEDVRRTISAGDRRALRGKRIRGHLRECEPCRHYDVAGRALPGQLGALFPAAPGGLLASLHGMLGIAGTASLTAPAGVGGLTFGGLSLGAKVAAVAVVGGSVAAGIPVASGAVDIPGLSSPAARTADDTARTTSPPASRPSDAGAGGAERTGDRAVAAPGSAAPGADRPDRGGDGPAGPADTGRASEAAGAPGDARGRPGSPGRSGEAPGRSRGRSGSAPGSAGAKGERAAKAKPKPRGRKGSGQGARRPKAPVRGDGRRRAKAPGAGSAKPVAEGGRPENADAGGSGAEGPGSGAAGGSAQGTSAPTAGSGAQGSGSEATGNAGGSANPSAGSAGGALSPATGGGTGDAGNSRGTR